MYHSTFSPLLLCRRLGLFGLASGLAMLAGCAASGDATNGQAANGSPPDESVQKLSAGAPAGTDQRALAIPTGERASSAVLLEQIAPQEARLNRPYEYQLRVTNLTDQPLRDVVVREQTPQNFNITNAQPTTRPAEGGAHEYAIGELGPRESRSITVTGTPTQPGDLRMCATVTYTPTLCATASVVNPVLRVSKSGPDRVLLCDQITYRYTVRNEGTGTERNVRVEDRLPEGLVTQDNSNMVTLNFGDVAAGETREQTVVLKANRAGSFGSKAAAIGAFGDRVESDQITTNVVAPKLDVQVQGPETAYVGEPVTYQVTVRNTGEGEARDLALNVDSPGRAEVAAIIDGQPKLLSIQGEPEPQQPRREMQQPQWRETQQPRQRTEPESRGRWSPAGPGEPPFAIIPGEDQANGERAGRRDAGRRDAGRREADQREGQVRYEAEGVGGRPVTGQQTIGPIAPGQSQTFNVTVTDPNPGVLKMTVNANAHCAEMASATAQTNVQTIPALLITAVDENDPVRVGNNVNYTITVRNQGSGDDHNVQITANLPEGLSYVSSSGPTQAKAEGQKVIFEPLQTLSAGQTVTWQVQAKAQKPGDYRFRVDLTSQSLTAGPANVAEPTRLY